MNIYRKLLISGSVIIMLSSCSDFFELERPVELPINTLEDLEMAAVSPYQSLYHGGWGALYSNNLTQQVMQSDCFDFLGNNEDYPTEELFQRRYNQRIPQVSELYNKLYNTIGLCNSGLYFYENSGGNPLPFESEENYEKNVVRVKGELYFNRAFSYYTLAQIFCPPYGYGKDEERILVKREKMVESSEEALNNTPSPTSEIYSLILEDLDKAIQFLPEQYENGMHRSYQSRGRANRWAAKALLAQVHFTMQNFKEAVAIYDDIIENGGYDLEENPFTNFNNESVSPLREENKEVIMWIYYGDADLSKQNNRHDALRLCHFNKCHASAVNGGNGPATDGRNASWSFHDWVQMCLAHSALKKMNWMDENMQETAEARYDKRYYNQPASAGQHVNMEGLFYRFEGVDPEWVGTATRKGASSDGKYIIFGKYLLYKGRPVILVNKYYRTISGRLQNQPLYRMGEIYLNRAAARLASNIPGWENDFNKVASRAWNDEVAGRAYTPKSASEVTQELIRIERWKELAGEDSWYTRYCAALGLGISQGERNSGNEYMTIDKNNFDKVYWKECIPLGGELDFRQ